MRIVGKLINEFYQKLCFNVDEFGDSLKKKRKSPSHLTLNARFFAYFSNHTLYFNFLFF